MRLEMQTRNKIFDDLSELMTNALGVAQGAKDEADTAVRGVIDRWLADKDLVSREELEVLKIMFEKLSKENADLKSRIEILEKQNSKT
jgi:BMFP domain-containing protein YqiC